MRLLLDTNIVLRLRQDDRLFDRKTRRIIEDATAVVLTVLSLLLPILALLMLAGLLFLAVRVFGTAGRSLGRWRSREGVWSTSGPLGDD